VAIVSEKYVKSASKPKLKILKQPGKIYIKITGPSLAMKFETFLSENNFSQSPF
jgi:hypothetical protein